MYVGPHIIDDNLTFAIDVGSTRSYPGTGTTVNSLTGVITGTLVNSPGIGTTNGGYIEFDGADDKLTLSTNINLGNGNLAWTVLAWVRSTTTVNSLGHGPVASNDGSGPVYSMMGIN